MEQHYAYDAPPHGHQPHHSHHSSYDARPQHPYSPPHSNPQSNPQSQYPMPPPPQSAYPPPPAPYDPALDYRSPPPSAGHYTHSPTHAHTHTLPQPLPSMTVPMEHNYGHPHVMDTTGQVPPNGMRPRLTTSVFEEEGSICFQVDVDGICVARREDNHMINGTKLLNVARMTRGRRDGILKAEKQKNVVKIGPMHLKGVWIPFERALSLANQEKITEQLYPLFVHNIGSLLYHPSNAARVPAPAAQARAGALADGAYRAEVPRGQEYPSVGAAQGGYATAPGGYGAANGAGGAEAGVEGSRQDGERL